MTDSPVVPSVQPAASRALQARLQAWLAQTQADSPWIVWLHDAPAAPPPAAGGAPAWGGFGKSTLLRQVLATVRQRFPRLPIVSLDGLDAAAQERFRWVRQVVAHLEAASAWRAERFHTVWAQLQAEGRLPPVAPGVQRQVLDLDSRTRLWTALASDLAALRPHLPAQGPTLLVVVDHLDLLQPSPQTLVLAPGERFPERFGLPRVKTVLVSRQSPDWQQPLWCGRQHEIWPLAVPPWTPQDVQQALRRALDPAGLRAPSTLVQQASALLHQLTGGQPTLVQLACTQLAQGCLPLEELQRLPPQAVASRLLSPLDTLEGPLAWWLLVLAHWQPGPALPGIPLTRLAALLARLSAGERQAPPIALRTLVAALRQVPGVRLSGLRVPPQAAQDEAACVALQAELRRLLVQAGWEPQDPDRRFRRALSRVILAAASAEDQPAPPRSETEAAWQASLLEQLAQRLELDREAGLHWFERPFSRACLSGRRGLARALLETVREVEPLLTPPQRWQLRLWEVRLLRLEERPAQAQALLEHLRQEADPAWQDEQQEALLYEQARCALQQGRVREAIQVSEQCLALAQRRGNEERASTLQGQLGYLSRRLGHWEQALHSYAASLAYHQQRGSLAWSANLLNSIGHVYRLQGHLEAAWRYCWLGLRVREELWRQGQLDERAVGLSHGTLVPILLESGDLLQAEQHLRLAWECYAQVDDRKGLAATALRQGQLALLKGQCEEADAWFSQAEALVTGRAGEILDEEVWIASQCSRGRAAAAHARWPEAVARLQRACEHARHVQDRAQLALSLCELMRALAHLGRQAEAEAAWQEARALAEEEGDRWLLGYGEEILGDLAYAAGRWEEAMRHYVASCAWLAHHHRVASHQAQRRVLERLLACPLETVPALVQAVREDWRQRGLAEAAPELDQACEEILRLLPTPDRWPGPRPSP
uniref:Uncharacterized protein n=1 Tax=Thermogemmatispora argillosa TaxID=2045280 RepID=A0A455T1E3_9CHLR|nr:hypothetical protein KTA_04540 [Thermogemmatispora argillosa]